MADNPWSGIQNIGAIDQKLYQRPTKADPVVPSSPPPAAPNPESKPVAEKGVTTKPVAKPSTKQQPVKQKQPARKAPEVNVQLNAWITASQNAALDQVFYGLRANGVKLKKGELVGIGIEVLAAILEQHTPKVIDNTLLDIFLSHYEKQKQKKP
jgi:hypothetical protein